jgi:Flp pilus assembly protein TadB
MVIAPKFMEPMLQKPPEMLGLPLGVIILGLGGVMMVVGFFLIRKIVNIEV